jgi:osmotically-inducible protein OsmY
VKIITQNGHVTLRGQVASAAEKQRVVEIAGQVVQPGDVSDQLVIAQNPGTTVQN